MNEGVDGGEMAPCIKMLEKGNSSTTTRRSCCFETTQDILTCFGGGIEFLDFGGREGEVDFDFLLPGFELSLGGILYEIVANVCECGFVEYISKDGVAFACVLQLCLYCKFVSVSICFGIGYGLETNFMDQIV